MLFSSHWGFENRKFRESEQVESKLQDTVMLVLLLLTDWWIIVPGYLKILEIPKGARHLLIQEFKGTPHVLGKRREVKLHEELIQVNISENLVFLFLTAAMKNQDTGQIFLNDEDELPDSRVLIEKGVVWEYSNHDEQEFIQTTGPLTYSVLLMVSPEVQQVHIVSG